MRKLWKQYQDWLEKDFSSQIFDNIKNLLVCSLLFAAGTNALGGQGSLFMGLAVSDLTGWGLIAVSAVLLVLNISDGLRRMAKMRHHLLIQLLVFVLYILVAERIVEIVWGFRSA